MSWDGPGGRECAVLAPGVAAGVVNLGRPESVPLADTIDLPEEHLGLALPGHLGELVHRGDQERGELAVDLLIDDQDRDALVRGLPPAEGTLTELVPAVD